MLQPTQEHDAQGEAATNKAYKTPVTLAPTVHRHTRSRSSLHAPHLPASFHMTTLSHTCSSPSTSSALNNPGARSSAWGRGGSAAASGNVASSIGPCTASACGLSRPLRPPAAGAPVLAALPLPPFASS